MLDAMSLVSPTMEGFRAAWRRPSLTVAEILWRWSVGATATLLLFFGVIEYLDSLPATNREMLLLRTRQPFLVGQVIAHILHARLGRAVLSTLLAAVLLTLLWMVAASLGRIATVTYLLDYFRMRFNSVVGVSNIGNGKISPAPAGSFSALLRIHFLRAVVVMAAIVCFAGAAMLAGSVSPDSDPQPGIVFILFFPLAVLIAFVAWTLNWVLSLAAMLAVREDEDAMGAISAAVTMCRKRTGAVFAVSSWTGLAHLVAFGVATTVVSVPLSMAGILPGRLIVIPLILLTLAYFAVADWLYIARLAGYVCIAEAPKIVQAAEPPPVPPVPVQTTMDRDEPILSDVSGLLFTAK